MKRIAETSHKVRAGCRTCHGDQAHWLGRNALAMAAQHHDRTGHQTWCEQELRTVYGAAGSAHPDLFQESTS
ncbi:Uncharacterised protein [Brevundimonas diminuta]|jgi:hypothetical protein|uniref:hypothetical protein n=1 Tax=Brevundimonas diminuta TaxID=293 RepID=UPI0005900F79|nr:hypothetical protein [Brevundimonas diminuta]OWR21776.1 hypothetical protein CD944_04970 [Brevundimonas diminuta]WQE46546.1 hypothetical protein U0020_06805 [Brevundimonas diminuta]SPU47997.1 Uncharacterised protein [Brevundimonas diminuta]SUW15799.1 Uncharacterised protein [Brevundimonas diminuta]